MCRTHFEEWRDRPTLLCMATDCQREARARGYCKAHWKTYTGEERSCADCGATFVTRNKGNIYCTNRCRIEAAKGPMRRALERGDREGVIAAARAGAVVDGYGCWVWQLGIHSNGYPWTGGGGTGSLVHRRVMEATLGQPLSSEPVHHRCAVIKCVNPDHLQLVSHRENAAEMLARNHYLRRIAELEAALMDLAPNHPLLTSTAS